MEFLELKDNNDNTNRYYSYDTKTLKRKRNNDNGKYDIYTEYLQPQDIQMLKNTNCCRI
jgi:hypothetical protein